MNKHEPTARRVTAGKHGSAAKSSGPRQGRNDLMRHFYGSAAVGERGQIVIPKEARDEYDIKPGDKIIFFGVHGCKLVLVKAEEMREFAKKMLEKI